MRVSANSRPLHKAIRKAGGAGARKAAKKASGKAAKATGRVIEASVDSLWNSLNPLANLRRAPGRPKVARIVATRMKVAFPSGPAPATHYRMGRGKHAISIFMPTKSTTADRKGWLSAISRKLGLVSPKDRLPLKGILLDPGRNPTDAYFAKAYKMPGFSSAAAAGDGWIRFFEVGTNGAGKIDWAFLHEQGHNIFEARGLEASWKHAMRADGRSLTHYATKAPTEDFAETFQALAIARRKGSQFVNWLKRVVPNRYRLLAGAP